MEWARHTSARLRFAPMVTMTIIPTLVRHTAITDLIGSQTDSSLGLARGSMDITAVVSMAAASMVVVSTAGVITVVVVIAIATEAGLIAEASEVMVGSTAGVASMAVVADSMAVVEATEAAIAKD